MKTTIIRSVTGLFYLAFFIGALLIGPYGFASLFFAINLIALWEFYRITSLMGYKPFSVLGLITGATIFFTSFLSVFFHFNGFLFSVVIPLFVLIFISTIYSKSDTAMLDMVFTVFGVLYIAVPLTFFNYISFIANQSYNFWTILGFFILLWVNDTFAYIFGVSFGKHRLFEKISPKKSWEGFFGGTLFTLILSFFMAKITNIFSLTDWIIIGLIISIAGVYGDLFESFIKRSVNIKDSGKLLPGHGGMLDRIDSALLSSPLVFTYLVLFSK